MANSIKSSVTLASKLRLAVSETSAGSEMAPGLFGMAPQSGPGVLGIAKGGSGVEGFSDSGTGVMGSTKSGWGVAASSESGDALYAEASQGHRAAYFKGDVYATGNVNCGGDLICAGGADCAEYFDVQPVENPDPGTVMVLRGSGILCASDCAYDKRVAGVVAGGGTFRSAILLDKPPTMNDRKPIALMGKVYCKADAAYGPIEAGDLLTSSETPGHAMKALDQGRAFGAILGKALKPLSSGKGLIPILVTLQ